MKCPKCGKVADDSFEFCPHCGEKKVIEPEDKAEEVSTLSPPSKESQEQPAERRNPVLGTIGIILVFLALILVVSSLTTIIYGGILAVTALIIGIVYLTKSDSKSAGIVAIVLSTVALLLLPISFGIHGCARVVENSGGGFEHLSPRLECMSNLRLLQGAINGYQEDNNKDPESLEALLQEPYVREVPTCPSGTKPYELVGQGATLEVVCPNNPSHTL